jgi:uroporphyrinogen decarboxylase
MNGLELMRHAVAFEPVERTPVVPQIFAFAGRQNRVAVDRYVSDGETQAECQIAEWRKLGHDAVFAFMGLGLEAEALGAELAYHEDRYPDVASHRVASATLPRELTLPDPESDGRIPQLLRSAEILRERTEEEAAVVGVIAGPLTIVTQLLGAEPALECAIDEPDLFAKLLDVATECAIRLGSALIDYGTHVPLIFDPSATPEFVPPRFFREYEMPNLRRIAESLKTKGAEAVWLHIAGDVRLICEYYPQIGVDVCNFDYSVPARDIVTEVPGICLDGNIKPFLFIDGKPETITTEANTLIDLFTPRGGFILSSGCEIPPESAAETVAALVAAAKHHPLL